MSERTQLQEVRELLIEKTREGRVQDWIERMAEIAGAAGLGLHRIMWQGSPQNVAFNIVENARTRDGNLDTLKRAIEAYKSN